MHFLCCIISLIYKHTYLHLNFCLCYPVIWDYCNSLLSLLDSCAHSSQFKVHELLLSLMFFNLLLSWKIVVVVIFWLMLQAVVNFITMQLQLCSVFFTFSLGTKSHYFGRTILHGGARVCSIIFFVEYLLFVFSAVECVTIIFFFLIVSSHWSWICGPPY